METSKDIAIGLTHEDSEIADSLGNYETVGAFRRVRAESAARDAERMVDIMRDRIRYDLASPAVRIEG